MLPGIVIAVALAAGSRGTSPPPQSLDMVGSEFSNAVASPNHLKHWDTPLGGEVLFISANARASGINNVVGTNRVTLGIAIDGQGTVCTLTIPCTLAPGDPVQQVSCSAAFAAGAKIDVEFSHTCLTAPAGSAVAGFTYSR